jgi:hypothetical protein
MTSKSQVIEIIRTAFRGAAGKRLRRARAAPSAATASAGSWSSAAVSSTAFHAHTSSIATPGPHRVLMLTQSMPRPLLHLVGSLSTGSEPATDRRGGLIREYAEAA